MRTYVLCALICSFAQLAWGQMDEEFPSSAARRPQRPGQQTSALQAARAAKSTSSNAIGRLQRASKDSQGKGVYSLVDRRGVIRSQVVGAAGVDLESYVGREVSIEGSSQFSHARKTLVFQAEKVTAIDSDAGDAIQKTSATSARSARSTVTTARRPATSRVQASNSPTLAAAKPPHMSPQPDDEQLDIQSGKHARNVDRLVTTQQFPGPVDIQAAQYAEEVQAEPMWSEAGEPFVDGMGPYPDPGPGCCGEVTYPLRSPYFVRVDFVNMAVRRGGLDYALVDPNTNDAPEGGLASIDSGRANGVNFGLGKRLYEGWEIAGWYQRLSDDESSAVNSPPNGQLWASLTHPNNVNVVNTAAANSSFDFDVLDLEVARHASVSNAFDFRMFGGWRFAWIDQDQSAVYNGGDANDTQVLQTSSFSSYGLRAGGRGNWLLGRGWSFFAEGSTSLLVGTFDSRLTETDNAGNDLTVDVTQSETRGVPVLDLGFGVTRFHAPWQFQIGYRLSHWFNMVDSRQFVDDVHAGKSVQQSGDLSLDGFFLGVGLGL